MEEGSEEKSLTENGTIYFLILGAMDEGTFEPEKIIARDGNASLIKNAVDEFYELAEGPEEAVMAVWEVSESECDNLDSSKTVLEEEDFCVVGNKGTLYIGDEMETLFSLDHLYRKNISLMGTNMDRKVFVLIVGVFERDGEYSPLVVASKTTNITEIKREIALRLECAEEYREISLALLESLPGYCKLSNSGYITETLREVSAMGALAVGAEEISVLIGAV